MFKNVSKITFCNKTTSILGFGTFWETIAFSLRFLTRPQIPKIIASIESMQKTYFQQENDCDDLTRKDTAFTINRFYLFCR